MTTDTKVATAAGSPDNEVEALQATLRSMRLSAMAEELPDVLAEAARDQWGSLQLLVELFRREEVRKSQRRFERNLRRSGLTEHFSIENYDFELAASRGVEPAVVRDLAECEFVRARRNLILAGAVGTGKTYLARTLCIEALRRGFKVLSMKTADLLDRLYSRRSSFQFGKYYGAIRDSDVLHLDDLAYMPYSPEKVELLFSLVVDRHELRRGSTIVTSNTDVTEWWQYFPSKAMGMAFSDRLLDGAQGLRFSGRSIRRPHSRPKPPPKPKEEPPTDDDVKPAG